ncbi:ribosome hibernation-promoting factor, HPF/YfiA family [Entomobacter blattae]|uniref:Ribosome hibernation promoting factor n=1 Tax=Entomobacter blattae TaxID=2762277 RepID=A0A7H1NSN3_9PROT|nr:ribosome-associated translation inhibitor RaiA [Entomobacter blattae]QNT78793.1 Ribosome hibernation promotion factor [Entomobacter blattae]
MKLQISGKQIDLSESLQNQVSTHLDAIIEKYFDKAIDAKVTFSKERSFFTCDINVYVGNGFLLRGEGEGTDAIAAFDDAAEHIAKRLRRYHKRISNHARTLSMSDAINEMAKEYILKQDLDKADAQQNDNEANLPTNQVDSHTQIITEYPTEIVQLNIDEALMRFDLADQNLLIFRNKANNQISILYKRMDGNISWIDTSAAQKR